jgi:ribosome-binding ATPase YchF (GTP1/OBG family)
MVKVGLVGKPSAGKSTFFSAATMIPVKISQVPFTTIDPNVGMAYVRVEDIGPEFGVTSQPRKGFVLGRWRFVPIELVDVAGLIPGAHEGKGLGNRFLNDLNMAEGLIHVVDISGTTDESGNPSPPRDPEKDILFLERELDMWYVRILKENWQKLERLRRAGKDPEDALLSIMSALRVTSEISKQAIEKFGDFPSWNLEEVASFLRKASKRIVIAGNKIDIPGAEENYLRLREKYDIIPVCAECELALKMAAKKGLVKYIPGDVDFEVTGKLTEEQLSALEKIRQVMKKYGGTGVQKTLEHLVFDVLGYIAVFPAGDKLKDKEGRILPDCFLLPPGSTVRDFAETIHSDIAKNLLYGIDVRTKQRLAKDHVLKHRDAVYLVSAARKG